MLESPKLLRYKVLIGVTEHTLVADPVGWSDESVARTRTEDFGVNSEVTVPLSFVDDGYELLSDLYYHKGDFATSSEKSGQFAVAYLIIEKASNDWEYVEFYRYRLDFSKAVDKMYQIDLAGVEEGLAVKFEKYKDTEYEIDLPATADKVFIDYSGASYIDKNTIQCGFGEMLQIGVSTFVLSGERSVRTYTDKLAFTDSNGLPYETMTFRALQTGDIDIDVFMNVTIKADAAFLQGTPDSGNIVLQKHNADFTGRTDVVGAAQIDPSSTSTQSNDRVDVFTTEDSWVISVVADGIYSFFYRADNTKEYDDISIEEGANCRVEFSALTASSFQNAKLEAFTYEWLIGELLKKIDSSATLTSNITYPNVKELLSATPCIANIGKTNGTGKLKTTLKDVLESYHKLHCTMHDITGSILTINPLASGYSSTDNGTLEVANIQIQHDTKHQYNKIKVGADTDAKEDDDPLIYPFICEKEYSVENSLADAELDLVNPFMLDCYAIDKYIRETYTKSDNKDECKFIVFACINVTGGFNIEKISTWEVTATGNTSVTATATTQEFSTVAPAILDFKAETSYINADTSSYSIDVINATSGVSVFSFLEEGILSLNSIKVFIPYAGTFYIRLRQISLNEIPGTTITSIANIKGITGDNITIDYDNYLGIYKNHTISGTVFQGDAATIYNIPLTPTRILQRWAEYLAISVVGSDSKKLKFQSSSIKNSGITSICNDWETTAIKEDEDFDLSTTTALFLPALITFDTYNDYDRILDDNKYGFYSFTDKKTNRALQGFINKTTYAVGANQTQQWELQAKTI